MRRRMRRNPDPRSVRELIRLLQQVPDLDAPVFIGIADDEFNQAGGLFDFPIAFDPDMVEPGGGVQLTVYVDIDGEVELRDEELG